MWIDREGRHYSVSKMSHPSLKGLHNSLHRISENFDSFYFESSWNLEWLRDETRYKILKNTYFKELSFMEM